VKIRRFCYRAKFQSKVIVRFDAKLQILLEARIITILHAENYKYWFRFLQVIED